MIKFERYPYLQINENPRARLCIISKICGYGQFTVLNSYSCRFYVEEDCLLQIIITRPLFKRVVCYLWDLIIFEIAFVCCLAVQNLCC